MKTELQRLAERYAKATMRTKGKEQLKNREKFNQVMAKIKAIKQPTK